MDTSIPQLTGSKRPRTPSPDETSAGELDERSVASSSESSDSDLRAGDASADIAPSSSVSLSGRVASQAKVDPFPLHAAAKAGDLKNINELLASKADPNLANEDGATPLHIAVENNFPEIVSRLLACGADPCIKSDYYDVPLLIAIENHNLEIAKGLIPKGDNDYQSIVDAYKTEGGQILLQYDPCYLALMLGFEEIYGVFKEQHQSHYNCAQEAFLKKRMGLEFGLELEGAGPTPSIAACGKQMVKDWEAFKELPLEGDFWSQDGMKDKFTAYLGSVTAIWDEEIDSQKKTAILNAIIEGKAVSIPLRFVKVIGEKPASHRMNISICGNLFAIGNRGATHEQLANQQAVASSSLLVFVNETGSPSTDPGENIGIDVFGIKDSRETQTADAAASSSSSSSSSSTESSVYDNNKAEHLFNKELINSINDSGWNNEVTESQNLSSIQQLIHGDVSKKGYHLQLSSSRKDNCSTVAFNLDFRAHLMFFVAQELRVDLRAASLVPEEEEPFKKAVNELYYSFRNFTKLRLLESCFLLPQNDNNKNWLNGDVTDKIMGWVHRRIKKHSDVIMTNFDAYINRSPAKKLLNPIWGQETIQELKSAVLSPSDSGSSSAASSSLGSSDVQSLPGVGDFSFEGDYSD